MSIYTISYFCIDFFAINQNPFFEIGILLLLIVLLVTCIIYNIAKKKSIQMEK